jgi:uncharacterized protein YndB with AHSA1/START domain
MPRPVLWLIACCVCLLVVFVGVGRMLVDKWEVRTTRAIAVPPARVYQALTDLAHWQDWCTLDAALGPNTQRTVTGEPGKTGSAIVWRGQGEAKLELVDADPATGLLYKFSTAAAGELSSGGIVLKPDATGTQVTWWELGQLPTLTSRWVAWFGAVQEAMRNHQETSLANLKQRLEEPVPAGK